MEAGLLADEASWTAITSNDTFDRLYSAVKYEQRLLVPFIHFQHSPFPQLVTFHNLIVNYVVVFVCDTVVRGRGTYP